MWGRSGGTPHSQRGQNWPASATSTETWHRQICVCAPAASSFLNARPLPRTALSTGTAQLVPLVHPLSLLPKTPPGTTHLHQPRALSLALTNNSFFHFQGKKASCPCAQPRSACWQLVGRACGRQDRPVLGPSVCPSVRPAAALLRALTSALPAAGRWAGGTAPIVLKIIQRSTNSLQISVTARRN